VFSDVSGKSASAITAQLSEHPGEPFDVTPFVHGRCKTPVAKIQEAVDGIFSHEQAEKLKIIHSHMDSLEKHKAELESLIFEIAQNYIPQIELLTVPGIHDAFTAIRLLAEIGADMTMFDTSKHLCSWAGLTPQNAESAGKKKTTSIGKLDLPFTLRSETAHFRRLNSAPDRHQIIPFFSLFRVHFCGKGSVSYRGSISAVMLGGALFVEIVGRDRWLSVPLHSGRINVIF